MSKIALEGNSAGTGTFTIASPNSNTSRSITLPDAAGAVVLDTATQTLTNKTVQGGTVQSATAQASTSGTNIDFTGIPSWVKRIAIVLRGVSTTGTSIVQIRLGTGTGPTYVTSGYDSRVFTWTGGTQGAAASSGFILESSAGAAAANTRTGVIYLVNISGDIWNANGSQSQISTNGANSVINGSISLAEALTAVRITTVNGTDSFDAGSINILYE